MLAEGQLELRWTDPLSDETGYRIEQRAKGSTNWAALTSLPASAGTGLEVRHLTRLDTGAEYRVMALLGARELALKTSSLASTLTASLLPAKLALQLSSPEPLRGETQISLSGGTGYSAVRYYLDSRLLAAGGAAPTFTSTWNTAGSGDGQHQLLALVQTGPDSFAELRRNVLVGNPALGLSLSSRPSGQQTIVEVQTFSRSGAAVSWVELAVDGKVVQRLLQSNAVGCVRTGTPCPVYAFTLNNKDFAYGSHPLLVSAMDASGEQARAEAINSFNSPPQISLSSPIAGQWVDGLLRIQGQATDDSTGGQTTITLGDVEIKRQELGSFDISYSLADLPNGRYLLKVESIDADGTSSSLVRPVLVHKLAGVTLTRLLSLDEGARLVAAEGSQAIVQQSGQLLWWRDAGSTEMLAMPYSLVSAHRLVNGRLYVSAVGDSTGGQARVLAFNIDGQRNDLASVGGLGVAPGEWSGEPAASGDWVAWGLALTRGPLAMRHMATGEQHVIALPAGATGYSLDPQGLGMSMQGARLYFTVFFGDSAQVPPVAYVYNTSNRSLSRLSAASTPTLAPKTDWQRVAWQDLNGKLYSAPAADAKNPSMLSEHLSSFSLRDGLLAWVDQLSDANSVKVVDGQGVLTELLNQPGARLFAIGGGVVLYGVDNRLWMWTPQKGAKLLLDGLPIESVQLGQGQLFLTIRDVPAVYRLTY